MSSSPCDVVVELVSSPVVIKTDGSDISIEVRSEAVVVEVAEVGIVVELFSTPALVLEIGIPGLQGGVGPAGPQGIPGAAGVVDLDCNCLAGDAVNDLVYFTGDPVLGKFQVSKVDIDDDAMMPAIGLIIAKAAATDCTVRSFGDIPLTGLTTGALYFVGTSGTLTATRPPSPGAGVRQIQRMGVASSPTVLPLRPDFNIYKVIA